MGNFKSGIIADSESEARTIAMSRKEGKILRNNTISNVIITKVTKGEDDMWIVEGIHDANITDTGEI